MRIRMGAGNDGVGIGQLQNNSAISVFAADFIIDLGAGDNRLTDNGHTGQVQFTKFKV